jgi:hypothetical protein
MTKGQTARSQVRVRRSASAAPGVRRQGVSSWVIAGWTRRQPGQRRVCPSPGRPTRNRVPHQPHGSAIREPQAAPRIASASSAPWVIARGRYRIRHVSSAVWSFQPPGSLPFDQCEGKRDDHTSDDLRPRAYVGPADRYSLHIGPPNILPVELSWCGSGREPSRARLGLQPCWSACRSGDPRR